MPLNSNYLQELKEGVEGDILSDPYSLGIYATDASIYQMKPSVVVLPKNIDDVKLSVEVAARYQIPILPRGGGTSLAGQTVGTGIVIDFSKYLNKIIEIDEDHRWVRVEPGVIRDELNHVLATYGLHFAPDPATSSRANIGGMIGNNSSGTKSIIYGKTVDHVLALKVLLADGTELLLENLSKEAILQKAQENTREGLLYKNFIEIIEKNQQEIKDRFPKVMRRVGGYNLDEFVYKDNWNLAKLITGSEGTLAVILEAKLNLEPLPKYKSVVVAHYNDLNEAISSVPLINQYQPSAVEILDRTVLGLSRNNLTTKKHCGFIQDDPEAILIIEFYGTSETDVVDRPNKMIEELKSRGLGYAFPLYREGETYEDVWIIRKKGLGLMLGLKGDKKPIAFIEDACVPVQVLPEYVSKVLDICKKYNTKVAMYAHASVGVIHIRPILDLRKATDIENFKNIANETFELVVKYNGSWSGEHGDGLVRSPFNERFFGAHIYDLLKQTKRLFDPQNIMNPGKIVEAGPIDNNLRYGTSYAEDPIKTEYHYRMENGFGDAVHMCTGVGECRKLRGGTMCPSFRATLDEEHSTRGRANALRLAISNQLDHQGLTGERIHEILDLCLSCKACKSECPSNVDMAKLKSEVTQMYYDKHGIKFRDRLIRDSSAMARRFSGALAGPVNAIQGNSAFRSVLEKITGFDKRRILPEYTNKPFHIWHRAHQPQPKSNRKVALFADTYLNYHDPQIGIAAVELLNSCGYEVELAQVGCCQRPKISHGFLRNAKQEGWKTALGLKQYIDRGIRVVVCEPSCASALNDDLPDLLDDEVLGNDLRKNVMMIDQFIEEERRAGRLSNGFTSLANNILIHGHCHQKALYGINTMQSLLQETNSACQVIPSGCCGMAGSFGYEKEHYDLSRKIGENSLFPAIRAADNQTTIVANGFSCRHQIAHFTGVKAKHWVEIIRAL